jgi:hypothetical protein
VQAVLARSPRGLIYQCGRSGERSSDMLTDPRVIGTIKLLA